MGTGKGKVTMPIPANVARIMVFSWQRPPGLEIQSYVNGDYTKVERVKTTNRKAVEAVCVELTDALREGNGEVILFPWGWSYFTNQGSE